MRRVSSALAGRMDRFHLSFDVSKRVAELAALQMALRLPQHNNMSKRRPMDSEQGATPEMAGDTTSGSPERERIAMRAYELYQARGGGDGLAEEDWLTAERELSNGNRSSDES
jgi:Protein of unknown function (DUF2934)